MPRDTPPRPPLADPAELADAVAQELVLRPAPALLVATGQSSPKPDACVRVGVLALPADGARPALLADDWLAPFHLAILRGALARHASIRLGEWDVLRATAWSFAWTTSGAPFELWDAGGRVALDLDPARVRLVEAWVASGWTERGVAALLTDGSRVDVARAAEAASSLAPGVDAGDLDADGAWTRSLARALAASLGVPFEVNELL